MDSQLDLQKLQSMGASAKNGSEMVHYWNALLDRSLCDTPLFPTYKSKEITDHYAQSSGRRCSFTEKLYGDLAQNNEYAPKWHVVFEVEWTKEWLYALSTPRNRPRDAESRSRKRMYGWGIPHEVCWAWFQALPNFSRRKNKFFSLYNFQAEWIAIDRIEIRGAVHQP